MLISLRDLTVHPVFENGTSKGVGPIIGRGKKRITRDHRTSIIAENFAEKVYITS